jgi:hypothetical protein
LLVSNRATRCGGTSGGSSSTKGRKRQTRWYRRGRTEVAMRRRGGGGSARQRRSEVSGELRWSAEVVAGAWSTGKRRGSEERRQFGHKTRGGGAHHEAEVAAMAAPNRRSGAASGAREGPRELATRAGRVRVLELGRRARKGGNGVAAGVFETLLGGAGQRGKRGSAWARPRGGGRRRRGGLAWRSAVRGRKVGSGP